MRFAIDAVWVDQELNILAISAELAPWRTARCKGAKGVLELPAGEAERRCVAVGDALRLRPAEAERAARAA